MICRDLDESIRVQQQIVASMHKHGQGAPCWITDHRGNRHLGTLGELFDQHATMLCVLHEFGGAK